MFPSRWMRNTFFNGNLRWFHRAGTAPTRLEKRAGKGLLQPSGMSTDLSIGLLST